MIEKPEQPERRKNPARKRASGDTVPRPALVEYHVVQDGKRWNVERDATYTGSFAYEVNTAIGLATSAALRDRHNGFDASVCVQQANGLCRHVWP
jgi:hypothetical protein